MDTPTIQRVRSHGAKIDRYAFEFADRFMDAFFARCAHLRGPGSRFRGTPESQRRAVAQRWAWFVRNLGEIGRISPELEAFANLLRARGVSAADMLHARAALLESLRDVSGESWNAQIEADWAGAFDCIAAEMFPTPRQLYQPGYAMAA